MTCTWNSSEGISAKLRMLACAPSVCCRANATTLAAISPTLTHWKRIERKGLSSDRGMKTTGAHPLVGEGSLLAWGGARASAVLAGHPQHVAVAAIVGVAAGHEQEIGKPVDVLERWRAHVFVGLVGQRHHAPLRPPADGTRHVQRCGRGRAARKHERCERRQFGIELID